MILFFSSLFFRSYFLHPVRRCEGKRGTGRVRVRRHVGDRPGGERQQAGRRYRPGGRHDPRQRAPHLHHAARCADVRVEMRPRPRPALAASPAARARRAADSGRGACDWLTRGGALAGTGFLPKETAEHHRKFVVKLVKEAIEVAGIKPPELDCVCYTKGPGMGGIARMPFVPPCIWWRCAPACPAVGCRPRASWALGPAPPTSHALPPPPPSLRLRACSPSPLPPRPPPLPHTSGTLFYFFRPAAGVRGCG